MKKYEKELKEEIIRLHLEEIRKELLEKTSNSFCFRMK
jgi:hypothetical protein